MVGQGICCYPVTRKDVKLMADTGSMHPYSDITEVAGITDSVM